MGTIAATRARYPAPFDLVRMVLSQCRAFCLAPVRIIDGDSSSRFVQVCVRAYRHRRLDVIPLRYKDSFDRHRRANLPRGRNFAARDDAHGIKVPSLPAGGMRRCCDGRHRLQRIRRLTGGRGRRNRTVEHLQRERTLRRGTLVSLLGLGDRGSALTSLRQLLLDLGRLQVLLRLHSLTLLRLQPRNLFLLRLHLRLQPRNLLLNLGQFSGGGRSRLICCCLVHNRRLS
mmetsp:Transcript_67403/g.185790  ORF Transcript_67403/g.185790 Transcript_67403/m.185790 type:complete len:229 (-) Transcript_67403:560-1246(-)